MKKTVQLDDLTFEAFISKNAIEKRIKELGGAISEKHRRHHPIFLGILNGAFIFLADLVRACDFPCEIAFLRVGSYEGTKSSGEVRTILGLDMDVSNRHVIIVEDIIDTGNTLHHLSQQIMAMNPASLSLATLLLKPDMLEHPLKIDFVGFEIPPDFVVGYGMDYRELGRNFSSVFRKTGE